MSVAEAKSHFSDCVDLAESGKAVVITRHKKAVAAIISVADLKHVEKIRSAGPKDGLAGIVGGWKNSDELADILQGSGRTPPRVVTPLD